MGGLVEFVAPQKRPNFCNVTVRLALTWATPKQGDGRENVPKASHACGLGVPSAELDYRWWLFRTSLLQVTTYGP